ncbi:MAG: hypothetical protein OXU96_04780 [Gammaproteobacteria bacterium]|nr:hypothetical protein [Gammaproteobacteria bacterium]
MKFEFTIQLLTLASAIAASAAAWMAVTINRRVLASESLTKRRKLFDAIYYHIRVTRERRWNPRGKRKKPWSDICPSCSA